MKIMLDPGVVAWSAASRKIHKLVVLYNKCWTFVLYCTVLYCTVLYYCKAVVVGFDHSSVAVCSCSCSLAVSPTPSDSR